MIRRVVSILHRPPARLCPTEPALEANAYALAEDLELTLLLRGPGVEFAVPGGEVVPRDVAGEALPAASGHDLRGLIESGVTVYADAESVRQHGLAAQDLVVGVRLADQDTVAEVLRDAGAVLNW